MTTFLLDSFTDADDTPLASHLPDEGEGWEAMSFDVAGDPPGVPTLVWMNRLHTQGTGNDRGATHRNATDPGADEYQLSALLSFRDPAQFNRFTWLCWRMSPTGTEHADVDHYFLLADNQSDPGALTVFKVLSGTLIEIASEPFSWAGQQFTVTVHTAPGDTTVFVDDVALVTTDDADIVERGRVGVGVSRATQNANEQWLDDFTAENFVEPEPEPDPDTAGRPIQSFAESRPIRPLAQQRPGLTTAQRRPIRPFFTTTPSS